MFSDHCTVVSGEGVETTMPTDYRENHKKPLYTAIKIIDTAIKGKDVFPIFLDLPVDVAIFNGIDRLLHEIIETLVTGETYACLDPWSTRIGPKCLPCVESCHLKFMLFFYSLPRPSRDALYLDVGVCTITPIEPRPLVSLARTGPTTACGGIPIRRTPVVPVVPVVPVATHVVPVVPVVPVEPDDIEERFNRLLNL